MASVVQNFITEAQLIILLFVDHLPVCLPEVAISIIIIIMKVSITTMHTFPSSPHRRIYTWQFLYGSSYT